jgi:phospholysine phosphohistidine inorganic pyrophosphate phosphatase
LENEGERLQGLLIDLDGVLYVGDAVVPGAIDAIDWVERRKLPHLFVTNTTSRPRSAIVDKLSGLGFRTTADHILTPPVAAAGWLAGQGLDRVALFMPAATASEFAAFRQIEDESPVDAVVVGDLGEGWDFHTLNRAFRLLMLTPQPKLIALGMTRYWRAADGLRLDTAPFVMALSHASGVMPTVLGKPADAFFSAATRLLGVPPEETVMIGDDIRTDVQGAQAAGIKGVLVRTGKFREADLDSGIEPAGVLESIAALPAWWALGAAT